VHPEGEQEYRWYNGSAQREYEFLERLDSYPDMRKAIEMRKDFLRPLNTRDFTVHVAFGLGLTWMFGFHLLTGSFYTVGLYLMVLATYHLLEYLFVLEFHPKEASHESFLLNPNPQYRYALAFSVLEYFIEWLLVPSWKDQTLFVIVGILMIGVGQFFRTGSMWTAKSNFHHLVREEKEMGHQLITSGVYSFSRHPSYLGWFTWALGTQVLLLNPISFVGWAYVLWDFFSKRIIREEIELVKIFGDEYRKYQQTVPICILKK